MELPKIVGYLLLTMGVLLIFWSAYSSYNIFNAKIPIPELFKSQEKEISPIDSKEKVPTSEAEFQEQIGQTIGEQLKGILPVDTLPKLLNLVAWSILAGILIFAGTQIAGLGIKLIKD